MRWIAIQAPYPAEERLSFCKRKSYIVKISCRCERNYRW
jgi:hypothetical protein